MCILKRTIPPSPQHKPTAAHFPKPKSIITTGSRQCGGMVARRGARRGRTFATLGGSARGLEMNYPLRQSPLRLFPSRVCGTLDEECAVRCLKGQRRRQRGRVVI